MKLFVLFVAILSVAVADWAPLTTEGFLKVRQECFDQENISTENRELIKNQKFPAERDVNCYIRCVGLKTGTWDDRNGYNVDRVYRMFEARNLVVSKEHLERCFNPLMDADTCTWAAANMRCLTDNKYISKKN